MTQVPLVLTLYLVFIDADCMRRSVTYAVNQSYLLRYGNLMLHLPI